MHEYLDDERPEWCMSGAEVQSKLAAARVDWLAHASRDEMAAEILRMDQEHAQQEDLLEPIMIRAGNWVNKLGDISLVGLEVRPRGTDPFSCMAAAVEAVEYLTARAKVEEIVEAEIAHADPGVLARIVMQRRREVSARPWMLNGPKSACERYLRNGLSAHRNLNLPVLEADFDAWSQFVDSYDGSEACPRISHYLVVG